MAKILIAGDSWGCGEWGNYSAVEPLFSGRNHAITHLGLEQYLIDDGHEVHNLSKGGLSNNSTVINIQDNLHHNYDYIFWFQTDPVRDILRWDQEKSKWFNTFDHLVLMQEIDLRRVYKNLNQLNTKIHCIGGCSKLDVDRMQDYSNLIPFIPSVIEFLIPNFRHPKIWFTGDWVLNLDEKWDLKTLDIIIHERKQMMSLPKISKYFHLDGGHPDREGHKVIFEHIKKQLPL